MKNYICVYDFETDGTDPKKCEPVQIAAVMLNPITLEIVENSEFSSFMRPYGIDDAEYFQEHEKTIHWHAKNYESEYPHMSSDEKDQAAMKIFDTWKEAPYQSQVFADFAAYLIKYNTNQSRRTKFTAPIRAGANIRKFDNVILDRKCCEFKMASKEGEQKIFHPRDIVDIIDLCFYWFENLQEPKSYSMDELRKFFGLSGHGAHDALNDVRDESAIIRRFLKLHREIAPKVKFKNSMLEAVTL